MAGVISLSAGGSRFVTGCLGSVFYLMYFLGFMKGCHGELVDVWCL